MTIKYQIELRNVLTGQVLATTICAGRFDSWKDFESFSKRQEYSSRFISNPKEIAELSAKK